MPRLRQFWFDGLPLVASFGLLWALGQVWLSRLTHPYDLEWMEGGMLTHSWRILEGLPLYPEPSPEFIPFIYPPGYSSLLALMSQWWTLDYTTGRTLSILGEWDWNYYRIPSSRTDRTVFKAENFPSHCIVAQADHWVAVKDDAIWDTWDSRGKRPERIEGYFATKSWQEDKFPNLYA